METELPIDGNVRINLLVFAYAPGSDTVMYLAYTILTSLATSSAPRQEFIERRLAFKLDVEGSTVEAR